MATRIWQVWVGIVLVASGALMYAASWERWAGACGWTGLESDACVVRQDHLYDFLLPSEPWQPVGQAAQLGGLSLLVLALALPVLPWALTGRRPGPLSAVALVVAELVLLAVGAAVLRTGQSGEVTPPVLAGVVTPLWLLVPPILVGRLAVAARGWARAAAVVLVLATPFVAFVSYSMGSFDAAPWWEAMMGALTAIAGALLLVAATRRRAPRVLDTPARIALPA